MTACLHTFSFCLNCICSGCLLDVELILTSTWWCSSFQLTLVGLSSFFIIVFLFFFIFHPPVSFLCLVAWRRRTWFGIFPDWALIGSLYEMSACRNGGRQQHFSIWSQFNSSCPFYSFSSSFLFPHVLTLRWLMSYIYGAPILDVSRSHTTTHHSR